MHPKASGRRQIGEEDNKIKEEEEEGIDDLLISFWAENWSEVVLSCEVISGNLKVIKKGEISWKVKGTEAKNIEKKWFWCQKVIGMG